MPARESLLAGAGERDLTKLAEYRAIGGYQGVEKARAMTPDDLITELQEANLRGRGGAGFPMGRKASLIDRKSGKPAYLVVNADESEPGAFKDREVMSRVPHRLIEGCLIAAHAIEAERIFIYIRGEYLTEYEILQAAVDEARKAGVFGGCDILVHRGAGAYICGEETALLDSLEGRRGQPRPRPPFPPVQGLYDAPTQINNVCTIATVPIIMELGASEFAKIGSESSPGTAIFSISGNIERPGQLRARARHADAGARVRHRRRRPGRPAAEVRHPRRLVGARAHARPARHAARLRLDPGRRLVLRRRVAHRRRRPLLHGAARAAGGEVLHARVVRQVHAVPRGNALDGAAAGEDRGGGRVARRPRPSRVDRHRHPRPLALRARRLRRLPGVELHAEVPGRVPRARRARQLPVRRLLDARRHPRAVRRARARTRKRPCMPDVQADDRRSRGPGAGGHGPRGDGGRGRHRDSRLLLRAAARRARRRLPHVPRRDRGHPEAAGRLHADGAGRHGREDGADVRARRGGAELDARVHPRQPPARLPRLRQGRRVPAPGPHVPLRPRLDADDVRQADAREADPDLADDRARPRALHPLLPLHALLGGRRGGRPADRARPWRAVADRDVRGPAVPRAVLGERHRALPRRRADLDALPLRGPSLGDRERPDRLRALPRRLQRQRHVSARATCAGCRAATTPRSTGAGSATRAASRIRRSAQATA